MRGRSPASIIRLLFHEIKSEDLRRRRLLGIVQGAVTGFGSKLVGVLVAFLSVPLTIGYLGPERYGAWVTLGSLLAWLQLTDFGLGNGLTNAMTTAAAQDRPDLVRMHVSNAAFLLSAIAGLTGLVAALLWPFLDWSAIFGLSHAEAKREIGPAVAVALGIHLLGFPLAVTGRVYLAYQEGRIGSYWGMAGNLLGLTALVVVTRTQGGLAWLVFAASGTGLMVNVANAAWVFLRHRPSLLPRLAHVELRSMLALGQAGSQFFLIQIMALVTFQSYNLVISHYAGAARVAEYSLTYSLFGYASLPQTMLFGYLWAAYAEAIARKDIAWVSRTFHLNLGAGIAFSVAAVLFLAAIAQPFIAWWAGGAVVPGAGLIGWMAAWGVINACTNPVACLLAAAGHLRAQLVYSALATALNLALSIHLVQTWGVEGVIAATVISYAIFVCIPILVDAELLMARLRRAG